MGVPSFSADAALLDGALCVCFAEIQFSKLAVGSAAARIEFPKRKHMLQWTEPAFLRPR